MMSEVYEVGRKSFEDMTEMLLNNKNISNDQRRGLRETYVLSKREEYCLIGKSDDEVEEIIRKKSPKDRLSMMKCFKVPYSQRKRPRRLPVDELIKSFQKEMNDCFPSLRRSLMNAEEKRQKKLADDRERNAIARANESTEKRKKRLAADKERHAIVRAKESGEKRQKRMVADKERHAIVRANAKAIERKKKPTWDTPAWHIPGKDFVLSNHEECVETAFTLFHIRRCYFKEWEPSLHTACWKVHQYLCNKGDAGADKVRILFKLHYEMYISLTETLYKYVLTEDNIAKDHEKWRSEAEYRLGLERDESLIMWLATTETISKKYLRSLKNKSLPRRLLGLKLNVPGFWWNKCAKEDKSKLWRCEIAYINFHDAAERYFMIKCIDDDPDDPQQKRRYAMSYEAVFEYADKEHLHEREIVLPERLTGINFEYNAKHQKTLLDLKKVPKVE